MSLFTTIEQLQAYLIKFFTALLEDLCKEFYAEKDFKTQKASKNKTFKR